MRQYNEISQGTAEWHQLRKGKITGTTLKAIMGSPKARQDAIYELVAERLTIGVDEDYENPMDRGTRLEPEAIAAFEFETGLKVDRTGFCEKTDNSLIAQSPDGLIGDDAAIEIKCMGGKNHMKLVLTNEVPDDYHWQVVQYFVVHEELKTLYFVGYNPDIPEYSLHIIKVERESLEDDIATANKKAIIFLKEVELEMSKLIKI